MRVRVNERTQSARVRVVDGGASHAHAPLNTRANSSERYALLAIDVHAVAKQLELLSGELHTHAAAHGGGGGGGGGR